MADGRWLIAMDIVLFGKPGAGKGTQAPRIAAALGVPTVATGDVLRAAVRVGTPMGLAAKAYMDRGDLVPDDVILGIMKEALAKSDFSAGSLLDGVVRTTPQAEGMTRVLEELRADFAGLPDLLAAVRAQWPDLPVLLCSAAPPRRPEGTESALAFDACLLKPVQPDALLAQIATLAGASPPGLPGAESGRRSRRVPARVS